MIILPEDTARTEIEILIRRLDKETEINDSKIDELLGNVQRTRAANAQVRRIRSEYVALLDMQAANHSTP